MSDWRLTVQELAKAGGVCSSDAFGTFDGRKKAKALGLAYAPARAAHDARQRVWVLTSLGFAFLNGKVTRCNMGNPHGSGQSNSVWKATWLAPLL